MTMHYPLLVTRILERAKTVFPDKEIITRVEGGVHRYTYRDMATRANRLANALTALGVKQGDRVGTLAGTPTATWEAYFAAPCMGAINHTINIRLFPDDLVYIINHAQDKVLLIDPDLAPILEELAPQLESVEHYVIMTDDPEPSTTLPGALSYETLLAAASDEFVPAELDEYTPAGLCYTSATTGRPKGVVYSHRALYLHTMAGVYGRYYGIFGAGHGYGDCADVPRQLLGLSLLQHYGGSQPDYAPAPAPTPRPSASLLSSIG